MIKRYVKDITKYNFIWDLESKRRCYMLDFVLNISNIIKKENPIPI